MHDTPDCAVVQQFNRLPPHHHHQHNGDERINNEVGACTNAVQVIHKYKKNRKLLFNHNYQLNGLATKRVPVRSVLRAFLQRFETLEANSGTLTKEDVYYNEFRTLKEISEILKKDKSYMLEGEKDVNMRKNRYKDIVPFNFNRVILSNSPNVPGSDYINANYVCGPSGYPRAYIAAQGPLQSTLADFWRMIWECDVTIVIMVCNELESGKIKCECYWPEKSGTSQLYGNITVSHVVTSQICADFMVRKFTIARLIESNGQIQTHERIVWQFHYTTWPDHGVPNSVQPILELVRLIREFQSEEEKPILVHCSAGCGRTGTLCCIDYVWGLLKHGQLDQTFSLFEIITSFRQQRVAMVQTLDQYILCYRAVAALFAEHLSIIEDHTYENISLEGELELLEYRFEDNDGPVFI